MRKGIDTDMYLVEHGKGHPGALEMAAAVFRQTVEIPPGTTSGAEALLPIVVVYAGFGPEGNEQPPITHSSPMIEVPYA